MATKTRRAPTEEQKQAAAERRARIKEIAAKVSNMTPAQREAMAMRFGGIVTVEGRRLSPFNSCLLLNQAETVSMVGGFQQWRKAGRVVRKGSRGLAIWIPTGGSSSEDDESEGDEQQRFMLGTVFDVSQTDELAAETEG